jgi:hypothetical protein
LSPCGLLAAFSAPTGIYLDGKHPSVFEKPTYDQNGLPSDPLRAFSSVVT